VLFRSVQTTFFLFNDGKITYIVSLHNLIIVKFENFELHTQKVKRNFVI